MYYKYVHALHATNLNLVYTHTDTRIGIRRAITARPFVRDRLYLSHLRVCAC